MTRTSTRPRAATLSHADWRKRPGMLAAPGARLRSADKPVGMIFSLGDRTAGELLTVLSSLAVITIDRPFDEDAPRIVAASIPEIVVFVGDPTRPGHASAITMLAAQDAGCLLVADVGGTRAGAIAALEAGADATVGVHDEPAVVRATIKALLRRRRRFVPRAEGSSASRIVVGALTIDQDTFEVRDRGQLLPFTPTEFRIVSYLSAHVDIVRSPARIMSALHDYGFTDLEAQQTIRVYIRRIRRKLAESADPSVEIVNFRTLGYRLQRASSTPAGVPS